MSNLSKSAFLSKWNSLFADNSTRDITEEDLRDFTTDIKDSFLNILDQSFNGVAGWKNGLNTISGLKAVATTTLTVGVITAFRDTDNGDALRFYELVAGTDADNSPQLVRPTDYNGSTNQKVWKIATFGNQGKGFISTWDLSSNVFPGGITTFQGNIWKGINGGLSTSLTTTDGSKVPEGALMMANKDNPRSNNVRDWEVWYTIHS